MLIGSPSGSANPTVAATQMLGGDTAGRGFDGLRILADGEDEFQRRSRSGVQGRRRNAARWPSSRARARQSPGGNRLRGVDGHCRPHLALVVLHVLQRPRQTFGVAEHGLGLVGVLALGPDDSRPPCRDRIRAGGRSRPPPVRPAPSASHRRRGRVIQRSRRTVLGRVPDRRIRSRTGWRSAARIDDARRRAGHRITRVRSRAFTARGVGPPIAGFSFSAMMPSRRATSV